MKLEESCRISFFLDWWEMNGMKIDGSLSLRLGWTVKSMKLSTMQLCRTTRYMVKDQPPVLVTNQSFWRR